MAIENKLSAFLNKRKWIIPVLFGLMCYFLVSSIVAVEIRRLDEIPSTFAFSVGGEICAMMVAIMLTLSILPAYKRQSGYIRIFVTLLTIGCFSLHLDTIQMVVDGLPDFVMLNKVICVFVFANEIGFLFFFWLFVTYALKSEGKTITILNAIASISLLVFALLPFINFFYPLYFVMHDNGVYERVHDTWWICRIYIVMIAIFAVVAIILSKEPIKNKIVISVFMGLPFVAMGAGGYQYGLVSVNLCLPLFR